MRDVLVIAVSQSGSSPDLTEPLARAREAGAITVAVTNAPLSPLATRAEYHLDVGAGPERAVAATKSHTAELLTLYLLIDALGEGHGDGLETPPSMAREVLRQGTRVAELAVQYRFAGQLVVTARGYNYATARETALKLMETSYIVASPFSGADLLHGPMATTAVSRSWPLARRGREHPRFCLFYHGCERWAPIPWSLVASIRTSRVDWRRKREPGKAYLQPKRRRVFTHLGTVSLMMRSRLWHGPCASYLCQEGGYLLHRGQARRDYFGYQHYEFDRDGCQPTVRV